MAGLHIATEPAILTEPIRVGFVGGGAAMDDVVDEVEAGVAVSISHRVVPGSILIIVNDAPCDEAVDVTANVELDVQIWWDLAGVCRVAGEMTHALGKVSHPRRGSIVGAVVPQGATVTFRPVNPLSTSPRVEVVAGPTGIEAFEIPPETYEVTVTQGGELLMRTEVDLVRFPDIVLDLMTLASSVPRACNGVDPITCEQLIRAAMSYGQWVSPDDVVRAVGIQETDVMSCDVGIEPEFDVVFQMAPAGDLDVTVGRRDDGRWDACSPY